MFVLDLVISFFFFFFPLAAKLIGPRTGRQFFKNVDVLDLHPLKAILSLLQASFFKNTSLALCMAFKVSLTILSSIPFCLLAGLELSSPIKFGKRGFFPKTNWLGRSPHCLPNNV